MDTMCRGVGEQDEHIESQVDHHGGIGCTAVVSNRVCRGNKSINTSKRNRYHESIDPACQLPSAEFSSSNPCNSIRYML